MGTTISFFSRQFQKSSHQYCEREYIENERSFFLDEHGNNSRFLRLHIMPYVFRGYMTPTISFFVGCRLMQNMTGKASTKHNFKFITVDINSNPCVQALSSKVQEFASIRHIFCKLTTESDDNLIAICSGRTSYSKTHSQNGCKYKYKLTFSDVKIKQILSYFNTTTNNTCVEFSLVKEYFENRPAMLNKTQLFVLDRCTNAKKILQFIQKSKIFHTQYDFMNLVPKSIGSDIKTSITVTDENRTAFLSLSDGDNLHHVQCREEFKINCSETAHTYKKQCLKDRTVQVNLSDTPDIDMGYIVQETKLLNSVSPESFELETGGFVQVRSGLNSESLDVSKNELKENLEGQILETIPDYSENSNTETDVHVQNRTHLNCDCFKVQQIETKPVVHKTTELQKDLFSSYDNDWRSISSVEEYFDLFRETQTNCDDGFYPKKEKHRYFNFTRDILLYPVHRLSLESSFYQLLIGENRLSPDLMRYEFHRLNSFINFSNEWSPSRIKLARNGWFSTGNGKETKCFSCGVYYNSWTCESDPLDIHKKISPYCSMVNGMDENNVPISKEIETANSQTNRYEAHKNGYQRPSRLLSEFEIVENTKKPSDNQKETEVAKNLKQNSSDQRKTETENVSILSVDQLSLSSTFQNLGLACGTHNEGSEPETNPGTLSNICTNSNLTKCRAKQSVGGGKLYKYAISSDQKDAKYVNDTIENKVNGMNKSKQLPKQIGNDTIDKAYNGHHFQENRKPLLYGGNNLPKSNEKEIQLLTLGSVEMVNPKHPQYMNLSVRISSFRGWPSYLNQSERDLAIAGFYYKGYSDEVTCYQCGITLANWQENDDGFVEHAKWKPNCYYLRQYKGDEFVRLVQAAQNQIEIQETSIENVSKDYRVLPQNTPGKQNPVGDNKDLLVGMGFSDKEVDKAIDSLHVKYDDKDNGDITINEILEILCGNPATSNETDIDVTRRPTPTSTMSNTSFNESSIESSYLSGDGPNSSFVTSFRITQKENHTQLTQNYLEIKEEQMDKISGTEKFRIENDNENKKSIKCKICLDEEVGMIFIPCGHICACVTCSQELTRCPVCRKHIVKKIRGYLS